ARSMRPSAAPRSSWPATSSTRTGPPTSTGTGCGGATVRSASSPTASTSRATSTRCRCWPTPWRRPAATTATWWNTAARRRPTPAAAGCSTRSSEGSERHGGLLMLCQRLTLSVTVLLAAGVLARAADTKELRALLAHEVIGPRLALEETQDYLDT